MVRGAMIESCEWAQGRLRAAVSDAVGTLTINNPGRRNALDQAMWRAFPEAIDWLCGAGGARVCVLAGAAGTDFSAGADISEFDVVRRDAQTARLYEADNSAAFAAIREVPIPMIAAIRGICYGGGFGLAAACDLRLADRSARLAVPAARLGLAYPADAARDFHLALGPQMARKALFTGAPLPLEELLRCGFLLDLTETGALDAVAFALAGEIAENAPLSVRAAKLALRAAAQNDDALLVEADALGAATFESADYREGRAAFADRRKPQFTGR